MDVTLKLKNNAFNAGTGTEVRESKHANVDMQFCV